MKGWPMLDRINRILTLLFATGAALSMAAVFLVILTNSLRRYFLGRSWPWGEELPVFLAIYGVMFGIALAYLQDRHIRFTILTDWLTERRRDVTYLVVDVSTVIMGAMLARSGLMLIDSRGGREASGIVTTARGLARDLDMPWIAQFGTLGPWQFALVLGGALMVLAAGTRLARRVQALLDARG